MSQTHELKVWPEFFESLIAGTKNFELRKNDRGFQPGDQLWLREWNPKTLAYSGRDVRKRINYVLDHRAGAGCAAEFGLMPGYAILSLGDGQS